MLFCSLLSYHDCEPLKPKNGLEVRRVNKMNVAADSRQAWSIFRHMALIKSTGLPGFLWAVANLTTNPPPPPMERISLLGLTTGSRMLHVNKLVSRTEGEGGGWRGLTVNSEYGADVGLAWPNHWMICTR